MIYNKDMSWLMKQNQYMKPTKESKMTKWYDRGKFYHIYPLGLGGAPIENNLEVIKNRLLPMEEWIPHIKKMGCNAIYIGPLFESVGHGYETTDYRLVDKRLGSNQDFKHFVDSCHSLNIRVIVDGVFNHTGREFFAFKDLKEKKHNSPYLDWFCNVNFNGNTEYNDGFSYENWGGYNLLVKLNQRNPSVKEYLYQVIRFWVEEFGIDGIRLDAADVLDFEFMKGMRQVVNELKEDFWLMGEVIHGDYGRWANQETLHSVTNYELHKALFSCHNDHNYFEIAHSVKRIEDLTKGINLYTFVDNHDVERIASKLSNKEHLSIVHILLYTLPGIPSIYYGSEFGIEGKKDKGSDEGLRPYLNYEDYKDAIEDNKLTSLIMNLASLRDKHIELVEGKYKELFLTNRQFAFGRFSHISGIVIGVNNDDKSAYINIALPIDFKEATDCLSSERVRITDNILRLEIPGNNGRIIKVI